jgi:hypothetical protein
VPNGCFDTRDFLAFTNLVDRGTAQTLVGMPLLGRLTIHKRFQVVDQLAGIRLNGLDGGSGQVGGEDEVGSVQQRHEGGIVRRGLYIVRFTRGSRDLKLHRPSRFVLNHDRKGFNLAAVADISIPQGHQVAASQFDVKAEIEQRKLH